LKGFVRQAASPFAHGALGEVSILAHEECGKNVTQARIYQQFDVGVFCFLSVAIEAASSAVSLE
jgi:hypothetical protein